MDTYRPQSLLLVCTFGLRIVYAADAWEPVLGHSSTDLCHTAIYSLAHPDDIEDIMSAVRQLAAGEFRSRLHARLRSHDGSYRALAWIVPAIVHRRLIFSAAHLAPMLGVTEPLLNERIRARHELLQLRHLFNAAQFGSSASRSPISTRLEAAGPSSTIVTVPGALSHT